MAQASNRLRYTRKLKRQRNQATRAAESFMDTAYKSRVMAMALEVELQKRDKVLVDIEKLITDTLTSEGLAPEVGEQLYAKIKEEFAKAPEKKQTTKVIGDVANQLAAQGENVEAEAQPEAAN